MEERFLQAWFLAQEGIGARALEGILEFFGSLESFYAADLSSWRESEALSSEDMMRLRPLLTVSQAAEYAARLGQAGVSILLSSDDLYPELLAHIPDPPPLLYMRGDLALLDELNPAEEEMTGSALPTVAIVGSRRATAYGKKAAESIATDLADLGVIVVSGLARGIDSVAHRGALAAKSGRTIAVVGTGLDTVYPVENAKLAAEIAQRGLIFSEYALGTPPLPQNFPRRNRIISGLSLGVLVVEAAEQSGSQITVTYALDQGREVFAVPGNIYSANSRGPHRLIKQGARLVESAEDILEELNLLVDSILPGDEEAVLALSLMQNKILELLDVEPKAFDLLQSESRIPVGTLLGELLQLELLGLITALPGRQYLKNSVYKPA